MLKRATLRLLFFFVDNTKYLYNLPCKGEKYIMNWLNLCSGGEIGRQAVKELGLPVTNWYSFEVDKFAIKVAMDNHDDVVQLGDIKNYWKWADNFSANGKDLSASIDVILCGSPCQGFSVAGKGLNFEHPQSKLFFECVKIYKTIYQANPNVKLLFENVRMKKEWQDIIVSTLQEINPFTIFIWVFLK